MRRLCRTALQVLALVAPAMSAAADVPLAGCYERVYDAAHLAAHKGQIVTRATLLVKAMEPMKTPAGRLVAEATVRMWAPHHKERFDSMGACSVSGAGLACGGSVSAAEIDVCKTRTTGVRDCRVDLGDGGAFDVAGRPDGLVVTVRGRLELMPSPYDTGPVMNLSGKDAENNSFLLKPAAAEVCK
jgi:hypothetical protein